MHYRFPSPHSGLSLFLRYLPPITAKPNGIVLNVHGGTFPSALSIAHRFDGRSWRDALVETGLGLDFHGFGQSDPCPQMAQPAEANSRSDALRRQANSSRPPCVSLSGITTGAAPAGPIDANEQQC